MTRDEVIKGLELLLTRPSGLWVGECNIIRAAISLLTPVPTAEIEAAREWLHCLAERPENFGHKHTALKSLDALAREPGMEKKVAVWKGVADTDREVLSEQATRIAALEAQAAQTADKLEHALAALRDSEAQLARVREELDAEESDLRYWGNPTYPVQAYRSLLLKMRAALAADAGPEVKP